MNEKVDELEAKLELKLKLNSKAYSACCCCCCYFQRYARNNNLLDLNAGKTLARVRVNHSLFECLYRLLFPLPLPFRPFGLQKRRGAQIENESRKPRGKELNCESFCFDNLAKSSARFFATKSFSSPSLLFGE